MPARTGASQPIKMVIAHCQHKVEAFEVELRDLPRTSREQAKAGIEVPKDPTQLRPGDLLYFGKGKTVSHIGIYVGDGKYVHAANRRKGVVEAALPTGTRAKTWWKGARRIFGGADDAPPITLFDSLLVSRTSGS